jgi:hypothetical protein
MSWLFKSCGEDTTTRPPGELLSVCTADPCGPSDADLGVPASRERVPKPSHYALATFFQPPTVHRIAASVARRGTAKNPSESGRTASTAALTEYDRSSQSSLGSPILHASDPSAYAHAYQEDLVVLGRTSDDSRDADLDWQERGTSRRNRNCCDTDAQFDCLDTPIDDESPIRAPPHMQGTNRRP